MARNVDDLYNLYRYILRKERGVFSTTAEFTANFNTAQLDSVQQWFSGYGINQSFHDALRMLRVYQPYTSDNAGFVSFPSNYLHLLGSPFTVAGSQVNAIRFVNEDEITTALTSQLRPVSNSYPVAVDIPNGFSIYPQQTQIGAYWYLRFPNPIVYGYTQVGRAITYNSLTSVQPDFPDEYVNNIIAKALKYAGANMNERAIFEFATQYDAETKEG